MAFSRVLFSHPGAVRLSPGWATPPYEPNIYTR
nr:MAG TPA: hypothetical protein [Caudoviricetes sp.]